MEKIDNKNKIESKGIKLNLSASRDPEISSEFGASVTSDMAITISNNCIGLIAVMLETLNMHETI